MSVEMDANKLAETTIKKPKNEIDLIPIFADKLESCVSKEAKDLFLCNDGVKAAKDKVYTFQRFAIDTFLKDVIYKYGGKHKEDMSFLTIALISEGSHIDWLSTISINVLPYLKKEKVIEEILR